MDLSHAEQLKTVVRWLTVALGKTQEDIARACGYENGSYFSQLLNGKKQSASSLDEKLAAMHPDLNVEYLRGNSEDMFLLGLHTKNGNLLISKRLPFCVPMKLSTVCQSD